MASIGVLTTSTFCEDNCGWLSKASIRPLAVNDQIQLTLPESLPLDILIDWVLCFISEAHFFARFVIDSLLPTLAPVWTFCECSMGAYVCMDAYQRGKMTAGLKDCLLRVALLLSRVYLSQN